MSSCLYWWTHKLWWLCLIDRFILLLTLVPSLPVCFFCVFFLLRYFTFVMVCISLGASKDVEWASRPVWVFWLYLLAYFIAIFCFTKCILYWQQLQDVKHRMDHLKVMNCRQNMLQEIRSRRYKGHLKFSGAFFRAEIFEKVSCDPYNFRITRLSARKSEQMKNF